MTKMICNLTSLFVINIWIGIVLEREHNSISGRSAGKKSINCYVIAASTNRRCLHWVAVAAVWVELFTLFITQRSRGCLLVRDPKSWNIVLRKITECYYYMIFCYYYCTCTRKLTTCTDTTRYVKQTNQLAWNWLCFHSRPHRWLNSDSKLHL